MFMFLLVPYKSSLKLIWSNYTVSRGYNLQLLLNTKFLGNYNWEVHLQLCIWVLLGNQNIVHITQFPPKRKHQH